MGGWLEQLRIRLSQLQSRLKLKLELSLTILHFFRYPGVKMFDVFTPVKELLNLDIICIDNNIFRLHYKVGILVCILSVDDVVPGHLHHPHHIQPPRHRQAVHRGPH